MNNSMKMGLVKAITLFSILIALSGMAAIASAADDPPMLIANLFYGNVTLNGADASPETVINAYIDEELRGSSENEVGSYYIDVEGNGSVDSGKVITFTVCGADADQTAVWLASYQSRPLDLTAVDDEAPAVTNADATPSSIVANGVDTTQLTVTVIDGCGVDTVTVNLSAIGGSEAQEMEPSGGDTDVYSVTVTAAGGTPADTYCLQVNASDVFGNYDDMSVCIGLEVTSEAQFTIHLDAGWNMVSIPVIPADASVDAIFGDNITQPVYKYDAGYKPVTTLEPKKGYWVLANSAVDISISGTVPSDLDVTVVPGWNMIGPVSSGVQVDSFTDVTLPVYGYAAGYNPVTTLEQTKGYWVLASAETTLTV